MARGAPREAEVCQAAGYGLLRIVARPAAIASGPSSRRTVDAVDAAGARDPGRCAGDLGFDPHSGRRGHGSRPAGVRVWVRVHLARGLSQGVDRGKDDARRPPIVGADGNPALPSEQIRLQFGLLFADGRRGAIGQVAPAFQREAPPTGELWLAPGRSGGSPQRCDREFWVYPLPPEGPVTFIASWPQYGVSEARVQVEAALIRLAAERATMLWPESEPPPPAGTG